MAAGALLMIVICVWLSRPVGLLELGEDTSAALGSPPARTRLLAIVAGVALVAIATAATGPIAFVALAAPHVGRRVTGASGSALVASAGAGAVLLASSDVVAQHALGEYSLPVGVVTIAVGGIYLASLLIRESRKGSL